MNRGVGLLVILGGGCLIVIGVLIYSGGLNWFGRLPGDIRYEGENARFYFPLVSLLLISLAINLIIYLVRKLL
jgi:hypothetical protein